MPRRPKAHAGVRVEVHGTSAGYALSRVERNRLGFEVSRVRLPGDYDDLAAATMARRAAEARA